MLWRKLSSAVEAGLASERVVQSEWTKIVFSCPVPAHRRRSGPMPRPDLLPRPVTITVRPLQFARKQPQRRNLCVPTGVVDFVTKQEPLSPRATPEETAVALANRLAGKGIRSKSSAKSPKKSTKTAQTKSPRGEVRKRPLPATYTAGMPTSNGYANGAEFSPRKQRRRNGEVGLPPVTPRQVVRAKSSNGQSISQKLMEPLPYDCRTLGDNRSLPIGWKPPGQQAQIVDPVEVNPTLQMTADEIAQHIASVRREGRFTSFEKVTDILLKLMSDPRNRHGVFNTPVDPVALELPTYTTIVQHPMDLGTIKRNLAAGEYLELEDFVSDVRLVFENAMLFNPESHYIHVDAGILLNRFNESVKAEQNRQAKRQRVQHCAAGCSTDIRKGSVYFVSEDGTRVWCQKCKTRLARDRNSADREPDDDTDALQDSLIKKKSEPGVEPWVKCGECDRWLHQVCGLYNPVVGAYESEKVRKKEAEGLSIEADPSYVCPLCRCRRKRATPPPESPMRKILNADPDEHAQNSSCLNIPSCELSIFIQNFLRRGLNEIGEHDAAQTLYVRALSFPGERMTVPEAVVRTFDENSQLLSQVRPGTNAIAQRIPAHISYLSRGLYLFQKHEGMEVCLFTIYAQEFGDDCELESNRRAVYIAYLDSVRYLKPASARTAAYHLILLAYFDYVRRHGFSRVHIWSCPPQKRISYVFWCRPPFQKTPSAEHLRRWYNKLLTKAKEYGIVKDWTTMYDRYFSDSVCGTIAKDDFKPSASFVSVKEENGVGVSTRGTTVQSVNPDELVWPANQLPPIFDGDIIPSELERILGRIMSRNEKQKRASENKKLAARGKNSSVARAGGKLSLGGVFTRIKEEVPTVPPSAPLCTQNVDVKVREVFSKCQFAVQRLKQDLLVVDLVAIDDDEAIQDDGCSSAALLRQPLHVPPVVLVRGLPVRLSAPRQALDDDDAAPLFQRAGGSAERLLPRVQPPGQGARARADLRPRPTADLAAGPGDLRASSSPSPAPSAAATTGYAAATRSSPGRARASPAWSGGTASPSTYSTCVHPRPELKIGHPQTRSAATSSCAASRSARSIDELLGSATGNNTAAANAAALFAAAQQQQQQQQRQAPTGFMAGQRDPARRERKRLTRSASLKTDYFSTISFPTIQQQQQLQQQQFQQPQRLSLSSTHPPRFEGLQENRASTPSLPGVGSFLGNPAVPRAPGGNRPFHTRRSSLAALPMPVSNPMTISRQQQRPVPVLTPITGMMQLRLESHSPYTSTPIASSTPSSSSSAATSSRSGPTANTTRLTAAALHQHAYASARPYPYARRDTWSSSLQGMIPEGGGIPMMMMSPGSSPDSYLNRKRNRSTDSDKAITAAIEASEKIHPTLSPVSSPGYTPPMVAPVPTDSELYRRARILQLAFTIVKRIHRFEEVAAKQKEPTPKVYRHSFEMITPPMPTTPPAAASNQTPRSQRKKCTLVQIPLSNPKLLYLCSNLVTVCTALVSSGLLEDMRQKMHDCAQAGRGALAAYAQLVDLLNDAVEAQVSRLPRRMHKSWGDAESADEGEWDLYEMLKSCEPWLLQEPWWVVLDDDDQQQAGDKEEGALRPLPYVNVFADYYRAIQDAVPSPQDLEVAASLRKAALTGATGLTGEWNRQGEADEHHLQQPQRVASVRSATAAFVAFGGWRWCIHAHTTKTFHVTETDTTMTLTLPNSLVSADAVFLLQLDQQEPTVVLPQDYFPFGWSRKRSLMAYRAWRVRGIGDSNGSAVAVQFMRWPDDNEIEAVENDEEEEELDDDEAEDSPEEPEEEPLGRRGRQPKRLRTRITIYFSVFSASTLQLRTIVEASLAPAVALTGSPTEADMLRYFKSPSSWEMRSQISQQYTKNL
ncbi:hypothetical protein ON010_g8117 [Phytophthora cinnamomi]|nr:hypothetical protein ON010_g8117 [Phytophthora cinnamomi]